MDTAIPLNASASAARDPGNTPERGDWRTQLRDAVRHPEELLQLLELSSHDVALSDAACREFAMKVPHAFVDRMQPGDPNDPLLRQVLATNAERASPAGYGDDPVGETGAATQRPGIIHKYRGRVLLIVASGCAVNCRYCFRRHFPYGEHRNSQMAWREALDYIHGDTSIEEVIFSGGDPLVATDAQLAELTALVAAIPHVHRLRIHSRLPVVLPDRITEDLVKATTHPALQTVMVVHANHAAEVDHTVASAIGRLRDAGVTSLNQAVLLRGINDSVQAQADLARALFTAGILPYYLHLLDKVRGAAHFATPERDAAELVRELTATLPGYLVPKLVKEQAGAPSKTRID